VKNITGVAIRTLACWVGSKYAIH